jgi:hypothetical protein
MKENGILNKVTTDTSLLAKTKGYWSKRDIYINNSEYVVLLKPDISPDQVAGIITRYIDDRLYDMVNNLAQKGIIKIIKDIQNKQNGRINYTRSFYKYGLNLCEIAPPMKSPWSQFFTRDCPTIASMVPDLLQNGICQSALKIDPPQASKIDPPQVVVFSYLFSF